MKNKTKIKFIGGCLDGIFDENVPPQALSAYLNIKTGKWFRGAEEYVEVFKGGEIDSKWLCYEVHQYKKGSKDKNGYFEYQFTKPLIIDRCTAITQKGKQCMNSQYKDLPYCKTHKKKALH